MTIDNRQSNSLSHRSHRQWAAVAERSLKNGDYNDTLLQEIIADGFSSTDAQHILNGAIRKLNKRASCILICSIALVAIGVSVTLNTLDLGTGYILWGAILCGGFGILYGISSYVK